MMAKCPECGCEGCAGTQAALDKAVDDGHLSVSEHYGYFETKEEAIEVAAGSIRTSESDPYSMPYVQYRYTDFVKNPRFIYRVGRVVRNQTI